MELIYPHLHPGQQEVWNERARFKVLASGRRWGKTMLGSLACIDTAKRGGRAWWVAPSYKMAQVGWRAIYRLCNQIPGAEIRRGDLMVIMPGGGSAQVRSADDPQSLRGEGLTLAVMDECAFMLEETWTEVLRPALSDKLGSALFISTPKRRNWFWQLYQRGQDGTERDWCSWRFPTAMNPYISPAEIAAAKQELPERIFEQEYLAEFLEGEGAVFRNIPAKRCISRCFPFYVLHAIRNWRSIVSIRLITSFNAAGYRRWLTNGMCRISSLRLILSARPLSKSFIVPDYR